MSYYRAWVSVHQDHCKLRNDGPEEGLPKPNRQTCVPLEGAFADPMSSCAVRATMATTTPTNSAQQRRFCDKCEEQEKAQKFCTSCNQFLCWLHAQGHQKDRATKNHQLLPAKEASPPLTEPAASSSSTSHAPPSCVEHAGFPLDLYCESEGCQKPICSRCLLKTHSGHKALELSEAASIGRQRLSLILSSAQTSADKLRAERGRVSAHLASLPEREQLQLDQLRSVYDGLARALAKQHEELEQMVRTSYSASRTVLSGEESRLSTQETTLNELATTGTRLLEDAGAFTTSSYFLTASSLNHHYQAVEKQLEQLKVQPPSLELLSTNEEVSVVMRLPTDTLIQKVLKTIADEGPRVVLNRTKQSQPPSTLPHTMKNTNINHGSTIVVAGGWDSSCKSTTRVVGLFLSSSTGKRSWKELTPLNEPRRGAAGSVVDHQLYVTGGWNGSTPLASVVYDSTFTTPRWRSVAPMKEPRFVHAAATIAESKLLVVGGITGTTVLSRVSQYSPVLDKWEEVADLPYPRFYLSASTLPTTGQVYAVGGLDEYNNWYSGGQSTVYVYDVGSNRWVEAPALPTPRSLHASGVVEGQLYVVGGDGTERSTIRLDPLSGQWTEVASMAHERHGHSVVVTEGRMYVLGGDHTKTLPVEEFCPRTNQWRSMEEWDPLLCKYAVSGVI